MRRSLLAASLSFTTLAACARLQDQPATSTGTGDDDLEQKHGAIASQEGGVEWSIDAPWRMEPPVTAIPITVTFHDASQQTDDNPLQLQRFCGLAIAELRQSSTWNNVVVRSFAPNQFHEIEASAPWPQEDEFPLYHTLAKIWEGQSPEGLLDINASAEWNATVMYTPSTWTSGQDLVMLATAIVSKTDTCPALPTTWSGVELEYFPNGGNVYWFQNLLRVHYGDAPLPRFDETPPPVVAQSALKLAPTTTVASRGDLTASAVVATSTAVAATATVTPSTTDTTSAAIKGTAVTPWGGTNPWVYGDLHYHAQGTDNEGESALSYRSVIQSMKAMGLDFLFATEHASNSIQLTDLDKVWVDNLPDPWWLPDWLHDYALDQLEGVGPTVEAGYDARRDMSDRRFRYLRGWLNDPNGVNQEVGSTPGGRVPQIFLGGEVDAIPEMSAAEKTALGLKYGDGMIYPWGDVCGAIPDQIKAVIEYTNFHICGGSYDELTWATPDGTYQIKDVQGLGDDYFARQHMVYLPSSATNADAFVPSSTSHFGGATRRLKNLLGTDNGQGVEGKGYVFLAHPVSAASGSGAGRLGPDIIPYSDTQLMFALKAPTVLGLQLWNEDTRVVSNAQCGGCYFEMFPGKAISAFAGSLGTSLGDIWDATTGWQKVSDAGQLSSLYHGAAAWDRMNLWGMNPSITANIGWVTPGQPRRVFMAGGSDAHGDLNYRREGAVFGWSSAVDSAIGKPRNLVNVGTSRPRTIEGGKVTVDQTQVVEALRTGNFVVTDGPIVRVAVDADNDGKFSSGDVSMGGVWTPKGTSIPVIVEWKSTAEFGPVQTIDLYVGAQEGTRDGLVYAPAGAGVRGPGDSYGAKDYLVANSTTTYHGTNVYFDDKSGKLRLTVPSAQGYGGVAKVVLDRAQYPVFDRACTTETIWVQASCDAQHHCTKPYSYTVDHCTATNLATPARLFVRAFAKATGTSVPLLNHGAFTVARFGYSNPVWIQPSTLGNVALPGGGVLSAAAL